VWGQSLARLTEDEFVIFDRVLEDVQNKGEKKTKKVKDDAAYARPEPA
jgi:preprotein translocase subunit SecF